MSKKWVHLVSIGLVLLIMSACNFPIPEGQNETPEPVQEPQVEQSDSVEADSETSEEEPNKGIKSESEPVADSA